MKKLLLVFALLFAVIPGQGDITPFNDKDLGDPK